MRHLYTKEQRQSILDKTCGKCGHCGVSLNTANMTIDHVFPVDKGGQDDEWNLLPLCKQCNLEKSNWVYKVTDFYKHILPEYEDRFVEFNSKQIYNYESNKLLKFDSAEFEVMPLQYLPMIQNMKARRVSGKKLSDTIKKLSMKVIMGRAYEGDAEEILEFLEKMSDKKSNIFSTDLYTNVYNIRNDIKYGEGYILRVNGNICGVILFKKIKPSDFDIVQLGVIEDNTRLSRKYIMTLLCLSDMIRHALPEIMDTMYDRVMSNEAIPMYFNILDRVYTRPNDLIMIPYKLDGVDGTLEFIHLKAIKEKITESVKEILKFDGEDMTNITDEDLEDLANVCLSSSVEQMGSHINSERYEELVSKFQKYISMNNKVEGME